MCFLTPNVHQPTSEQFKGLVPDFSRTPISLFLNCDFLFIYLRQNLAHLVFKHTHNMFVGFLIADTVTVDWLAIVTDEDKKSLLLLPWEDNDFSDRSSTHTYVLTDEFFTVSGPQILSFLITLIFNNTSANVGVGLH